MSIRHRANPDCLRSLVAQRNLKSVNGVNRGVAGWGAAHRRHLGIGHKSHVHQVVLNRLRQVESNQDSTITDAQFAQHIHLPGSHMPPVGRTFTNPTCLVVVKYTTKYVRVANAGLKQDRSPETHRLNLRESSHVFLSSTPNLPAGRSYLFGAMVYIYQSKWRLECDLNHPPAAIEAYYDGDLRQRGQIAAGALPIRQKRDRTHGQVLNLAWRNLMSTAQFDNKREQCNRKPGDLELGRRWFLVSASAAAAGLSIAGEAFDASRVAAQTAPIPSSRGVQCFTAAGLHETIASLEVNPGNKTIVDDKTFIVMLTVENNKAQQEFEWHEARDHVFQILEGSTVIEVGGTPAKAHSSKPGEWNAPESENAVKVALNKGDMLVIQRGVPHRRTTTGAVTLMLISPQGTV